MSRPFVVECEITSGCNLRCIHCYNRSGESWERLELPFLKDLMVQLKEMGLRYFDIVGGEPLVHPDIFEILRFAYKIGLRVIFNTNATLITKEKARMLKDANPHMLIGVSLDGSTPEVNDRIRGEGSFERTLRGAENLMEVGFYVTLMFVVNKLNWRDFGNYIELARRIGIRSIYVDRFMPIGRGADNAELLNMSPREWAEALRYVNDVIEANEGDFIFYVEESIDGDVCMAGITHFSILSNGKVVPCGHFRYREEFHLGDAREEPLSQIFRRGKSVFPRLEKCERCPAFGDLCFGGCKASAMVFTGRVDLPDPVICSFVKSLEGYEEEGITAPA